MIGLLIRLLAPMAALLLAAYFAPNQVAVADYGAAFVFALVISILNAVVRPVLALVTLPITCLTLGLFHFVLNAIIFALAATLVPGIMVNGMIGALIGSLFVSVVGLIASSLTK